MSSDYIIVQTRLWHWNYWVFLNLGMEPPNLKSDCYWSLSIGLGKLMHRIQILKMPSLILRTIQLYLVFLCDFYKKNARTFWVLILQLSIKIVMVVMYLTALILSNYHDVFLTITSSCNWIIMIVKEIEKKKD